MTSALVQKLTGVRDLKKILETTVKELGEAFAAESCQIMLSSPLDPNTTAICEYRASKEDQSDLPSFTLPLTLQGKALGHVSLARHQMVSPDEANAIRVTLGELADIIRHAQINDIVQRDTFRDTFLVEIGNVMAYSLGIGDALFMVVNILGKVLHASRCIFICTDDRQAGWKCFEFWQQDQVQSCQAFAWPTTDSPVVSQTLLAHAPLMLYEGQQNSYTTPAQEELQFIGVKSFLGVALRSEQATHGCVILQQCDYRRAWTRGEVDMVQNVADKVAEALAKLPVEKRAREPIMQLHQRTVAVPEGERDKQSIQSVRRALKGALGQQAIPVAQKTSMPPPAPAPAAPPPPAEPPAAAVPPPPAEPLPAEPAQPAPVQAPPPPPVPPPSVPPVLEPAEQGSFATSPEAAADWGGPTQAESATESEAAAAGKSIGNILGGIQRSAGQTAMAALDFGAPSEPEMPPAPPVPPPSVGEPAAFMPPPVEPPVSVDWGQEPGSERSAPGETFSAAPADWGQPPPIAPEPPPFAPEPPTFAPEPPTFAPEPPTFAPEPPAVAAEPPAAAGPEPPPVDEVSLSGQAQTGNLPGTAQASAWGDLDAIATPEAAPPAGEAAAAGGRWGDLDAIPAPGPAPAAPASQWGNLDAIPTPSAGPAKMGLVGSVLSKGKGVTPVAQASPLLASLHKDKSKFTDALPKVEHIEGPPVQIDEVAAEAKLKEILSSVNETSDYIFATPGLDARMLGRIDGWVSQIEQKDKYLNGHALQVAEYSTAIARQAGLSDQEVNTVRLAALVHDVGKLGAAPQILQKPDEELSDAELLLVMKHPLDGAELLDSFPDLKHLAPIVRAHHEEYDGNGYPAGLKGDEIPVAARIIHVADSYHVLTSPMRFRQGMSPNEAQQQLTKGAGTQYDPRFVEALILAIMQQKVPAAFA